MRMALYKSISREPVFQGWVDVADSVNDFDSWLYNNGYSRDHMLRREKIIEVTARERRALHRAHDSLKAQGKLPSVAWKVLNNEARS